MYLAALCCALSLIGDRPAEPAEPVPVLVELFTSEGCSSCPAADRWFAELAEKQPIAGVRVVPVALHVDYWDSLGWRDPFASRQFTDRQHAYADVMRLRSVYTPQMVVNGTGEFVGSDRNAARRAVAVAARDERARVAIDPLTNEKSDSIDVVVRVSELPTLDGHADLMLIVVVTEDDLHTAVARGENAGRKLDHRSVARTLTAAPITISNGHEHEVTTTTTTIAIDRAWRRDRLNVVAFIQDSKTMRVLGVATRPVTSP
jgi:hypothetical protein